MHWAIIHHASIGTSGQATFHTGLVSFGDRAILLPGGSGSGKSSLTLACVQIGAGFGGDDLAFLDLASKELVSFPLAPALSEEGLDLLGEPARRSVILRCEQFRENREVRCFLDTGPLPPFTAGAQHPAAVIFRRQPRADRATLEPLKPAEALQRLYRHAGFLWEERAEVFDALGDLVSRASLFDGSGDAEELAILMREWATDL